MRMKTALPTPAAFLVLAAFLFQAQESLGVPLKPECCFSFISRPIPRSILSSYEYTSPKCLVPGVIFTTRRGIKICADPSSQWTQDVIRYLEQKLTPSPSS